MERGEFHNLINREIRDLLPHHNFPFNVLSAEINGLYDLFKIYLKQEDDVHKSLEIYITEITRGHMLNSDCPRKI